MTLDPITRKFIDFVIEAAKAYPNGPTIEEGRRDTVIMQTNNVPRQPTDVEDRTVPVGPSGETPVRIIRPKAESAALPAVIYFHGGGWVFGDKTTHERLCREISHGTNAVVVAVDYARSPENRYPTAVEQAYAVTKWISEHRNELGVDPTRIAVAGDSSGGNLAAVVAILAKQRGGPRLACQVLHFPATDCTFDTPSHREFANDPFLSRAMMEWFWNQYAPDSVVRREITASPLRASLEQLRDLPPTLLVTAEVDVLRDEGEAYARKLIEAGVPVTATRYLASIHSFMFIDPLAATPASIAATAQTNAFLRRHFES